MGKRIIWLLVFCLWVSFLLASCGTSNEPIISIRSESETASVSASESEGSSFEELQKAAGVYTEETSGSKDTNLTVKDGVLYSGENPIDIHVKELNLTDVDFDDWSFLKNYSELELLYLDTDNELAYRTLNQLTNLKKLLVTNYPLETLEAISGCTELEALILSVAPKLKDISAIVHLKHLDDLELTNIPNRLDTSPLSELTNITLLKLNYISVTDIDFISSCTNLSSLAIHGVTGIQDYSPMESLSYLTDMQIVFTDFTQIEVLANLKNLKSLALVQTGLISFAPIAEYHLPLERFVSDASEEDLAILKEAYPDCIFE